MTETCTEIEPTLVYYIFLDESRTFPESRKSLCEALGAHTNTEWWWQFIWPKGIIIFTSDLVDETIVSQWLTAQHKEFVLFSPEEAKAFFDHEQCMPPSVFHKIYVKPSCAYLITYCSFYKGLNLEALLTTKFGKPWLVISFGRGGYVVSTSNVINDKDISAWFTDQDIVARALTDEELNHWYESQYTALPS